MTVFVTLNHFWFIYSKKYGNSIQGILKKKKQKYKKSLENQRATTVQIGRHTCHQLHSHSTDWKQEEVSALEMKSCSISLQHDLKTPGIQQHFENQVL